MRIQIEHRGLLVDVVYSCESDGEDEQFAVLRWKIEDIDEVDSTDPAVIRACLVRDREELLEMAREEWDAQCEREREMWTC